MNEVYVCQKVSGTESELVMTDTKENIKKFICDQAAKLNCGLYRFWYIAPFSYYDCGPVVYKVNAIWAKEDINNEQNN